MKKFYHTFALLLIVCFASAQVPQSIPYQAVARDSFGTPLPNQHMKARLTIHTGSSGGTTVYQETDTFTTNKLGMFTVNVGSGTVVTGTFSSIDWAGGSKYLQVEVDPAGGTSYTNMGASQLLSVPYALHAGTSSVSNVTTKHIPYGGSSGLTSDANFTRTGANGNTLIKTIKGDSYYALSLGDSTMLDVGAGSPINVPSAAMSYGDTTGDFSMNIGVGKVPGFGITQFGFLNLAKSNGDFAGIDFLEFSGEPEIVLGVNKGGLTTTGGSSISLNLWDAGITYSTDGSSNGHGIIADSTSLKIYSSTTGIQSWTWPNTDGTNGQVLTTNGGGDLSWSTPTGYGLQMGCTSFNPADTTTYYWGQRFGFSPSTSENGAIRVPRSGKIKAAYLIAYVDGTFGSSTNTSFYLRINGSTDYAISTTATLSAFSTNIDNSSLSISVNAGDKIIVKVVTPSWPTNPTTVSFTGNLYIE